MISVHVLCTRQLRSMIVDILACVGLVWFVCALFLESFNIMHNTDILRMQDLYLLGSHGSHVRV